MRHVLQIRLPLQKILLKQIGLWQVHLGTLAFLLLFTTQIHAKKLAPYLLAEESTVSLKEAKLKTKAALLAAKLQIIGGYAPRKDTYLYVVTHRELKKAAAMSQNGAFGAVARVSLTKIGTKIQISYTNPPFWAAAFRMKSTMPKTTKALKEALGEIRSFGSEDGLTTADLREYHYMFMMPYFDDIEDIGEASSHEDALRIIDANLKAKKAGARLVYKLNIPGTQNTVYGIAFRKGAGADATILRNCDIGTDKQTAYGPFELLVSGSKIIALQGRFRIAIAFPDLSKGTFMKIAGAPGAIHDALVEVAAP